MSTETKEIEVNWKETIVKRCFIYLTDAEIAIVEEDQEQLFGYIRDEKDKDYNFEIEEVYTTDEITNWEKT